MSIIRGIGYLFILAAIGIAIWEAVDYFASDTAEALSLTPLGQLWCQIHCTSLQEFQPAVERHLSAGLWQSFIQPWILEPPALAVFFAIGVLILVLAWLIALPFRRRRRERSKSDLIKG